MKLDALQRALETAELSRPVGRVSEVRGGLVWLAGLASLARIGDPVVLQREGRRPLAGEVLQVDADRVAVLVDSTPDGVAVGDRAVLHRARGFAPAAHWIGRVIDPFGAPLDDKPL
ncbi:MAG: hypothetical protein KDH20_04530, partial [Rhodocyclaceae bacterium]|nr:hypothetical protein [Rhodocyclaceae bacterium]